MFQASLAFSAMVVGVKAAAASLPALEVVFFRSLLGSLMVGYLLFRKKISSAGKGTERKLLLLRGVSGFLALTLHFYTISKLPLGTAVILNYTGPLFVAIFAMIFLREKPGGFLVSMILVAFAGVYLLVGGGLSAEPRQIAAIFLAILSAILSAVAVLSIRAVGRRESPLTVIFYFTLISTVGSLFYLPFGFEWPNPREWFALGVVAVGSFYGQIWMTIAYRRAPASVVAPFAYLTPLLSFIYGLLFWKERLKPLNLLGLSLVILGGVLVSVAEGRRVPVTQA